MKWKEKWRCQKQNYISKWQKVFKPFDRSWIEIRALHSNGSKCTYSFIKDMTCVDSKNYTFKEHILVLFQIHLELLLVQHRMVVQTLLCLHTQPLVMICMCIYAMHVLNSMNNHNRSNMLYFKAWIIWNKSLPTIYRIFNFFHLLIYQWKLNNEIMDSCMAKYNHLGYFIILYSIGIPSFNQLASNNFCTKICCQIHLYKNTSPILKNQIQFMDCVFYLFQL